MVKEIPLTQGKVALVDDDVFQAVGHLKWYAMLNSSNWYAVRTSRVGDKWTTLYLHHCVVGSPLWGMVINHKRDSLDNRRRFLEITTQRKNLQDKKIHRNGHLAGTTFDSSVGRWISSIRIEGKLKNLGRFSTARAAHLRYLEANNSLTGENR